MRPGAVLVALLVAGPFAAGADDTLIRRDGRRESGRLQACVADRCQWNDGSVPRAAIAWLGLGEAGTPPPPADGTKDEVRLLDGRAVVVEIVGVSLGTVVVDGQDFDRADVRWLYFGSAAGAPRMGAPPAATPRPTPTVAPSAP